MSGIASETAFIKLAKQASKGTAPSAYLTAMAEQSAVNLRRDEVSRTPEHGIGANRATERRSATQYGSYLVAGTMRQAAYTSAIGLLLLGAGFKVTTTGASANKTHVFKLANRDELVWLSILSKIGTATRRAVDCRVSALSLEAGPDTLRYNATFAGLTLNDPAGTETSTDEDLVKLNPAIGSLTLTVNGVQIVNTTTDTLQRLTMEIANPLDENDRSLFKFKRADLPQSGLGISGTIEGLELNYSTTYNQLVRAGASSGEPSTQVATGSLVYKVESAVNIATAAVPYSLEVNLGSVEVTLDDFSAEGNNIVRWNTNYRMIDNITDPAIITLVNAKASY